MRRHATDVLSSTSRLLKSSASASRPAQPPAFYQAAQLNPPPILPPRKLSHPGQGKKLRPQRIVYEEDGIRRQFFRDFPFEALRPVSLVEGTEVGNEDLVQGAEWTRLSQRGGYPSAEDTIAYVLNLHHHHSLSMSMAYAAATQQFTELRARHEVATLAAQAEHKYYGANAPLSPFSRFYKIEGKALETLSTSSSSTSAQGQSKKNRPWTATVEGSAKPKVLEAIEDLDGGRAYLRGWALPAALEGAEEAEVAVGSEEKVGESLETRVAEPAAAA